MAKKIGDASMLARRASGFLIASLLSIVCLTVCGVNAFADTLDADAYDSTAVTEVMAASTEQADAVDQAANGPVMHDQTAGDQTTNGQTSDQVGTQTDVQAGVQTANNPTGDQTDENAAVTGNQTGAKTDVADQPTTPVNKPEHAGWMKDTDGSWYYYTNVNTAPSTGWLKIKKTWYYLDPADNGKMKIGKFSDGKANYIAAASGAMYAKQWVKLGSDWYYATSSGALKSGWQKSSGKWYWLQGNQDGAMATSAWITERGKRYYVDGQGVMKTGWIKTAEGWYYANKSGVINQNGWVKVKNKWYWMQGNKQGLMAANQWIADKGKRYYLTNSGAMATKWIKDGNDWYYANNSGAQVMNGWVKSGSKWYWLQGDQQGLMAANRWITDKGKRYYLTNDGSMAKKWIHIGNDWYYANNSGAQVMNGWIKSGSKWYWLQGDKEGLMLADALRTIGGKQYSFDHNGAMYANTVVDLGHNKVGYATSSGAIASVGTKEDGKLILRNAQGSALTGWQKIGGVWFYGDEGGVAHTGWLDLKGKKYWMDSNGVMATGVRTINGKRYVFSPSGAYTRVSAAHAATFERALKELESCTNASMTREQKLRAAFDHIRNDFREYNPRIPHMKSVGWESIYADDIFVRRGGNCLSCAAAMAFMAKAAGYDNVYACNSGGHGWAEVDGRVYDPEWSRHNAGNYFARPYGQSGGPGYASAISSGQAWMRVAI